MTRILRLVACMLAPVCFSSAAQSQATPVAFTGTLITPLEQIDNGTVLVQNGRILASGAKVPLPHPAMHPFGRVLAPLAECEYQRSEAWSGYNRPTAICA